VTITHVSDALLKHALLGLDASTSIPAPPPTTCQLHSGLAETYLLNPLGLPLRPDGPLLVLAVSIFGWAQLQRCCVSDPCNILLLFCVCLQVQDWLDFVVGRSVVPPGAMRRDRPPERSRRSSGKKRRAAGATTEEELEDPALFDMGAGGRVSMDWGPRALYALRLWLAGCLCCCCRVAGLSSRARSFQHSRLQPSARMIFWELANSVHTCL
jgi:hypothetical protein